MIALKNIARTFRTNSVTARTGMIGVHFSERALHLLQLKRGEGSLSLQACASAAFVGERQDFTESPKAVRTLMRRVLKDAPFRGRTAISTLPLEHAKLMSVSYPAVPADSEPATIFNLMADRVEGDLSDYVIDYVPVRTSVRDGERLCLVVVARRDRVLLYLETLAAAGFRVEALEVAPLSIRRLVEGLSSVSSIENVLVCNTGYETTHLTLISGRRLLANQTVPFGQQHILKAVAESLDITEQVAADLIGTNGLEAVPVEDDIGVSATLVEIVRPAFLRLVEEIDRAFLYAASESYGQAAKRIFMLGALSNWSGADRLLETLTSIPVSRVSLDVLPFDADANFAPVTNVRTAADVSVAAGLALHGLLHDD